MERSWNQVGIDAQERYDELSHKGWDWSSFYNGYLEGTEAERKATKPLDLGSVVDALINIKDRAKLMGEYTFEDYAESIIESCEQALATLRSTVTLAPVAIVDTIEQALKFYAFSDNKIDGTPIRDIACRVATTLRSTVTPAPVQPSAVVSRNTAKRLVYKWRDSVTDRERWTGLEDADWTALIDSVHEFIQLPNPVAPVQGGGVEFGEPSAWMWQGLHGTVCGVNNPFKDDSPEFQRNHGVVALYCKSDITTTQSAPVAKVVVDLTVDDIAHEIRTCVTMAEMTGVEHVILDGGMKKAAKQILTLLAQLPGVEVRGV